MPYVVDIIKRELIMGPIETDCLLDIFEDAFCYISLLLRPSFELKKVSKVDWMIVFSFIVVFGAQMFLKLPYLQMLVILFLSLPLIFRLFLYVPLFMYKYLHFFINNFFDNRIAFVHNG